MFLNAPMVSACKSAVIGPGWDVNMTYQSIGD